MKSPNETSYSGSSFEAIVFTPKIDDVLSLNDLVLATIKRNAPSAYKEADFVKLLENKGIGRPSTYASYLPTLVKREYISIS